MLKALDITLWERIRPPSFDGIVCSTHVVGPRVAPVKRQVAIAVSLGRPGALQLCLYVLSCNNQRAADDHGDLPEGDPAPSLLAVDDDLLHAATGRSLPLIERRLRLLDEKCLRRLNRVEEGWPHPVLMQYLAYCRTSRGLVQNGSQYLGSYGSRLDCGARARSFLAVW